MAHNRMFTLPQAAVSLAIAILVFGMVTSLLLNVRETQAQIKCSNNLRQISIGAHHWVENHNSFPPLGDAPSSENKNEILQSAFARLVPFMESTNHMYRPGESASEKYHGHSSIAFHIQGKFGENGTAHGGAVNQVWPCFIDPADNSADKLRDVPVSFADKSIGYYATANYLFNGLLQSAGRLRSEKYLDHSSNLILFAERPQICVRDDGETIYNLWGLGGYSPHMAAFAVLTPNDPPGMQSTEQFAPVLPLPGEGEAIQLRIGRVEGPIAEGDFESPIRRFRGSPCDPRLPIGLHRGGMQVAMADGSVRMFTPETSAWVFWSACVPPKFD